MEHPLRAVRVYLPDPIPFDLNDRGMKAIRRWCRNGPTHIAVGDGTTVFDPVLSRRRPWLPPDKWTKLFRHGHYLVLQPEFHEWWGTELNEVQALNPTGFFSHLYGVANGLDCVGVARKVLAVARIHLPRLMFRPEAVYDHLIKMGLAQAEVEWGVEGKVLIGR